MTTYSVRTSDNRPGHHYSSEIAAASVRIRRLEAVQS